MLFPIVILAGGLATRLRPLTSNIPKSLVIVNERPFIYWQLDFLKKQGVLIVEGDKSIEKSAELIIVVGGDGSILSAARAYVDSNIPILGINLGRLGFLADVSVESMISVVTDILNGDYILSLIHI